MKVTRKQLRQIINEEMKRLSFAVVKEAIEIDLMKSIRKDFNKISDITKIPPTVGMALASSDPNLEKMYIQYLQNLKPRLDAALPGMIEILKNLKKMYGNPKHPDHDLMQQTSDTVSKFSAAQAEIEKLISDYNDKFKSYRE